MPTTGKIPKLFYGHVSDESKLECGDVLRDRMLFHIHDTTSVAIVIILKGIFQACNSTKRIRIVKSARFSFHGIPVLELAYGFSFGPS